MINIVLWLLSGIVVGFLASRLSQRLLPGTAVLNSIAGMLGAILAGVTFLIFDATPLNSVNPWGLLVAVAGALVTISFVRVIYRNMI